MPTRCSLLFRSDRDIPTRGGVIERTLFILARQIADLSVEATFCQLNVKSMRALSINAQASRTRVPMSGAIAREPGRLGTLDALRGVAAFLVLTFHCWNTGLFPDLASVWGWRLLT